MAQGYALVVYPNNTSTCYKNCSDNINGNIYTYLNECISKCPFGYTADISNSCIIKEESTEMNTVKI